MIFLNRLLYRLSTLNRLEIIKKFRGKLYVGLLGEVGGNLRIADNVKINNPSLVSLGKNCYLGSGTQLYAWDEKIIIGDNVLVAAGVKMITRKHGFADYRKPIAIQGYKNAPIRIEDNVWIGFNAIILPGTTIGKGSIVGAGAVVTKDIMPYSIVGGIPAKLIRMRGEN